MGALDRLVARIARVVADQAADARWSPPTKVALRQLWQTYEQRSLMNQPLDLATTGLRIFSQFEEDGIILALLASLGGGARTFVDIGAGDGVYASNCANLAINFGFHGLFVEADGSLVARGRTFYANHADTALYPPRFVQARVAPRTINDLIRAAGLAGEIDLLSIDIDGNDYWIWEALDAVTPRVVVIETHPELGLAPRVAPYADEPAHVPGLPSHFLGASPAAMTTLAERRGYRLVAANRFGFNLFYLRHDTPNAGLVSSLSADDLFRHPRAVERTIPDAELDPLPFLRP
jgi:hypothetical protein